MPEGDTIYRAARALQKAIGGKEVSGFDTGLATLASVNDNKPLVGRTVEKVESRGKWCLIYFSGDLILVTHMLMSGSWHIYRTGEKWWIGRNRMRVAITCGEFQAVAFNVPIAEFHSARSLERSSQIPKLGPDLLADDFTIAGAVSRLRDHALSYPDSEIAVVLLNQRVIAGLGNVYKSEVAFAARVNPFRQMRTITEFEMESIADTAQRYMKANVADGAGDGIVTYAGIGGRLMPWTVQTVCGYMAARGRSVVDVGLPLKCGSKASRPDPLTGVRPVSRGCKVRDKVPNLRREKRSSQRGEPRA
jgi:endonuclease-8